MNSSTIISPYTKDFREEKSGAQIYTDSPFFGTYSATEIGLIPIKTKGKAILSDKKEGTKTNPNDPPNKRNFSPKILEGSVESSFGFKRRAEPTVHDLNARAHFNQQAQLAYDEMRYEKIGYVPTILDKKGVNLNQSLEEMQYIKNMKKTPNIPFVNYSL